MKDFFNEQQCEIIADALVDKGYIALDIKHQSICALSEYSHKLQSFSKASTGRNNADQGFEAIRSDETSWLNKTSSTDRLYLDAMSALQNYMNKMLYMGLSYHEAHYAYYNTGAFYKKHLDAFKGKSSRKLTSVLYLNDMLDDADGGEFCLYDKDGSLLQMIRPSTGKMVLFLSERFPHEVLPTHKERFSIAGWFRID